MLRASTSIEITNQILQFVVAYVFQKQQRQTDRSKITAVYDGEDISPVLLHQL